MKYYSKEEKLKYVKQILKCRCCGDIEQEDGIVHTNNKSIIMNLKSWIRQQKKPGNQLMKYSQRKQLSKIEKLEYKNMKLRMENAQ